eukprot:CAMPEP_0179166578 /NCGR_PEP_ID=MMETSP0796-20121207/81849_1 /TAXON_ID=73915 /ORGANISM="Pyrodinium bahamense, Strain pbaha01" /LENGTH=71 /DNA_ID=CAMNT_0020869187 /DNA_START=18 /DNA_END=230 /DNA_ORIENTATION=+
MSPTAKLLGTQLLYPQAEPFQVAPSNPISHDGLSCSAVSGSSSTPSGGRVVTPTARPCSELYVTAVMEIAK